MNYSEYLSMTWVYWLLMVAYAVTILSVVIVILSENRNPVKSLAWVTVLLLLPAVGLVIYIFFGRSFKNKRMISRRNKRRLKKSESFRGINSGLGALTPDSRQQIRLAQSVSGSVYCPGNSVDIFTSGREKFDRLAEDLRNAASTSTCSITYLRMTVSDMRYATYSSSGHAPECG